MALVIAGPSLLSNARAYLELYHAEISLSFAKYLPEWFRRPATVPEGVDEALHHADLL